MVVQLMTKTKSPMSIQYFCLNSDLGISDLLTVTGLYQEIRLLT